MEIETTGLLEEPFLESITLFQFPQILHGSRMSFPSILNGSEIESFYNTSLHLVSINSNTLILCNKSMFFDWCSCRNINQSRECSKLVSYPENTDKWRNIESTTENIFSSWLFCIVLLWLKLLFIIQRLSKNYKSKVPNVLCLRSTLHLFFKYLL